MITCFVVNTDSGNGDGESKLELIVVRNYSVQPVEPVITR